MSVKRHLSERRRLENVWLFILIYSWRVWLAEPVAQYNTDLRDPGFKSQSTYVWNVSDHSFSLVTTLISRVFHSMVSHMQRNDAPKTITLNVSHSVTFCWHLNGLPCMYDDVWVVWPWVVFRITQYSLTLSLSLSLSGTGCVSGSW